MVGELAKGLLEVMACPLCHGDLDYSKKAQKLSCKKCGKAYKVEDGIPIMLV